MHRTGANSFDTAFTFPLTPEASDIDQLGHVNNTVYVRWAEKAAVDHWDSVAAQAIQDAYFFVLIRHEIDYRDAVLPGETVEVRTWVGEAKGPRFDRFVDIRKPGSQRFSSSHKMTWCMIDAATRKPKRIGADVLAIFNPGLSAP